jgi:hypothetical protein
MNDLSPLSGSRIAGIKSTLNFRPEVHSLAGDHLPALEVNDGKRVRLDFMHDDHSRLHPSPAHSSSCSMTRRGAAGRL